MIFQRIMRQQYPWMGASREGRKEAAGDKAEGVSSPQGRGTVLLCGPRFAQGTGSSRPGEEPDLGQWETVSSGAVRCLSDLGQHTGPAGLSGWARGGIERGWSAGWEEVTPEKEGPLKNLRPGVRRQAQRVRDLICSPPVSLSFPISKMGN